MLWIIVSSAVASLVDGARLTRWLTLLMLLCIVSVAIFFYLYLAVGPEAVSFFQEAANIDLRGGYAGATMHVYGSFIFLTAGFFAAPNLVRGRYIRFFLYVALIIVAATSGRSALILSIPIGILVGLVFSVCSPRSPHIRRRYAVGKIFSMLCLGALVIGFLVLLAGAAGIDLYLIADNFWEKLRSGGGEARVEQFSALLDGARDSYWLGVGHGIGVSYIRNEEYPWRYELIWMATLLRVGLIGAIVYILPFCVYVWKFLSIWRRGEVRHLDVFLFSGFVAAFVASNTNPYIEGFVFQWMYIFPIVHFFVQRMQASTSAPLQ
ncbi:hypothetical protein [Ralstonia mannitolilytica]|uniref:hypothetical protein n=1 Tax=Ralstonia mannitolilytica TaxID=105219 RepID=UPI0029306C89|nr:hypothetical protein [Ralstonia mannitolilytica]